MKTITTLTTIAALIAGISIASAQNAGGPAPEGASPGNINKGEVGSGSGGRGGQSGNESGRTAEQPGGMNRQATGNGRFCIEISKGGGVECTFASLEACTRDAQPRGLQCSQNPNTMGTTGSK
jgi:hypothetical protein